VTVEMKNRLDLGPKCRIEAGAEYRKYGMDAAWARGLLA